jgi:hypothetical protein
MKKLFSMMIRLVAIVATGFYSFGFQVNSNITIAKNVSLSDSSDYQLVMESEDVSSQNGSIGSGEYTEFSSVTTTGNEKYGAKEFGGYSSPIIDKVGEIEKESTSTDNPISFLELTYVFMNNDYPSEPTEEATKAFAEDFLEKAIGGGLTEATGRAIQKILEKYVIHRLLPGLISKIGGLFLGFLLELPDAGGAPSGFIEIISDGDSEIIPFEENIAIFKISSGTSCGSFPYILFLEKKTGFFGGNGSQCRPFNYLLRMR